MSRSEVLALFATHDALLFPSLHDSGGTVVMEAIAHGRPVICLDLGGPAVTVDEHCARIVGTSGKTEEQVTQGLADAISEFARMTPGKWEEMRRAAVRRAQFYTPDQVIARVYGPILAPCLAMSHVSQMCSEAVILSSRLPRRQHTQDAGPTLIKNWFGNRM